MIWRLIVFPSGAETIFSVWILRPAEGASSSVSQSSMNARNASACWRACSVLASASSVSRLSTLGVGTWPRPARIAFSLGSSRMSAAMSCAMVRSLLARACPSTLAATLPKSPLPVMRNVRRLQAAGYPQDRAGRVAGIGRQQPRDGSGDLLGLAGPAHGDNGGDLRRPLRVLVEAGPDGAGCHAVDADTVGGDFLGQPDRHGVDGRLGRRVVHVLAGAADGGRRGDVDDGPAARPRHGPDGAA